MPRSVNPAPQFTRGGKPLAYGKMYYFESGTNTPKTTYKDVAETIKNAHPVLLDADGRLPNVFFSGVAKQILTDSTGDCNGVGVQIFNRDPVGQQESQSSFDVFSVGSIYQLDQIVATSDGDFYKSLNNDNTGFNPATDNGVHWQQIDFIEYYSPTVTFSKENKAISTVNGLTYISVANNNKDNEPSSDDGTNWALYQPVLKWVSGKTYAVDEQCYDKVDKRRYSAVRENLGKEPNINDGADWLPAEGTISTPVNVSPADGEEGVSRMPTITSSEFNVLGNTDEHEYSIFQVSQDGFTTVDFNSGMLNNDLESFIINTPLNEATEYDFRVRYKGERAGLSAWSIPTSFTTTFALSNFYNSQEYLGNGTSQDIDTNIDMITGDGFGFFGVTDGTEVVRLFDTNRGAGNAVKVIETGANCDGISEPNGITSFNSDGYSIGTDTVYNNLASDYFSLSIGIKEKFSDMKQYTGNLTTTTYSHDIDSEIGFMMSIAVSDSSTQTRNGYCWFRGMSPSQRLWFGGTGGVTTEAVWGLNPTSSDFSVGTDSNINDTGVIATMYLLAHNPSAGVFCGTYTGTLSSDNKVTTGFPVKTVIAKFAGTGEWVVLDKDVGVNNHLVMTSDFTEAAGGLQSFDSDGFTLEGSVANSVGTYYFIALADPSEF